MGYCVVVIVVSLTTLMHTDAWAQAGAAAPADRRAPPGGAVQAGVGSPAGAPKPVHIGTRANCSLPPCVTTAVMGSTVAPALFYEKARLLGGGQRADYHVKLCVFPGSSL